MSCLIITALIDRYPRSITPAWAGADGERGRVFLKHYWSIQLVVSAIIFVSLVYDIFRDWNSFKGPNGVYYLITYLVTTLSSGGALGIVWYQRRIAGEQKSTRFLTVRFELGKSLLALGALTWVM